MKRCVLLSMLTFLSESRRNLFFSDLNPTSLHMTQVTDEVADTLIGNIQIYMLDINCIEVDTVLTKDQLLVI